MSEENTQPQVPAHEEEKEIQSPEDQIADLTNKWKRTAADFENYKKRKDAEGKELLQYAKEMTVARLIPSLQSLEQVLKFAPSDDKYKDWLVGLKATIMQLESTMKELGVEKIKTIGEKFDPNLHEAVAEIEGEPGVIIKEVQPGFTLNGKLIIPARVEVGK